MEKMIAPIIWCFFIVPAACQQQRFKERPSDTVVVEGRSALLRCVVEHQQGRLQWVKDGFALGYKRSLPGYQRYRMVGRATAGEHHLEIVAVSAADQGVFQCQVSPGRRHTAIKADATLTVLVRPVSVRIVANGTETHPRVTQVNELSIFGTIGVNDLQLVTSAGESMTAVCHVKGSRPAAGVIWTLNGNKLTTSNASGVLIETSSAPVPTSTTGHQLFDTRSQLTRTARSRDNGALLQCRPVHPAFENTQLGQMPDSPISSTTVSASAIVATVRLSVLHPPNPPQIVGVNTADALSAGEISVITCTSAGGNPRGVITWYKNGRPIESLVDRNETAVWARHHVTADSSVHNAIYRCNVSSPMLEQPLSAFVQLRVNFGPEKVFLNGSKEVIVSQRLQAFCSAAGSNPPSEITWLIDNHLVPEISQSVQLDSAGWLSQSRLTALVDTSGANRGARVIRVTCVASNGALGTNHSRHLAVDVLRPPDHPRISASYTEPPRDGSTVELICNSPGGNPPAVISWQMGGAVLFGQPIGEGQSRVEFNVTRSHNAAMVTCTSENSVVETPLNVSLILTVHFPPNILHIDATPAEVTEGNDLLLTCETGPSLPAANITWLRNKTKIDEVLSKTKIFPDQLFGGYVSRSQLTLATTWRDNGISIECHATVDSLNTRVINATTLRVAHAPVFNLPRSSYQVVVNEPLVVTLAAVANPAISRYTVSHQGSSGQLAADRLISSDGRGHQLLRLSSAVTRRQAGWYHVIAVNTVGQATVRIHVDVLYAPQNVSVRSAVVSEGEMAVLQCTAQSNPAPNGSLVWFSPDGASVAVNRYTTDWLGQNTISSSLRVQQVTSHDEGVYTCVTNNAVGSPLVQRPHLLIAKCPAIDRNRLGSIFAVTDSQLATLHCTAQAVPSAQFTWSRNNGTITPADTNKYDIRIEQTNLTSWRSSLLISHVSSADLGQYVCSAANSLGHDSLGGHRVRLVAAGRPEVPSALHVLNVTTQGATLAWSAGFDGGYRQFFRVVYSSRLSESRGATLGTTEVTAGRQHVTLTHLSSDTEYRAHVLAINRLGTSDNTSEPVDFRTLETSLPVGYVTNRDSGSASFTIDGASFSSRWVMAVAVSAAALLFVNISIVSCFVHRRRARLSRGTQKPCVVPTAAAGARRPVCDTTVTCAVSTSHGRTHDYRTRLDSPPSPFGGGNWLCDSLPSPIFQFKAHSFRPPAHAKTPALPGTASANSVTRSMGDLCDLIESAEQSHTDCSWQMSTPHLQTKRNHGPAVDRSAEYDQPRLGGCLRTYTTLPCRAMRVPSSLLRMRPITPPLAFDVRSSDNDGASQLPQQL